MSYRLGKSIVATVTYYDVLDMPLTAFEIWKHLIAQDPRATLPDEKCALGVVCKTLFSGTLSPKIEEQNGLYFLAGRSALVRHRIRAEKISVLKLKRMKRLAGVLASVPYLRMLAVTGSLAMKNGARESDWDMLVVLRSGKIWTGRTMLTGFLHLLGKRRHGENIRDRACLNYFITDDHLEIASKDLFSAHEYRFCIPLLNFSLFQRFELKNRWIREYRPNFTTTTLPSLWTRIRHSRTQAMRDMLETVLDLLDGERWLAGWQKEKIKRNPKTHIRGSLIETNDHALIFLPRPRGPRVFEKFKERLSA